MRTEIETFLIFDGPLLMLGFSQKKSADLTQKRKEKICTFESEKVAFLKQKRGKKIRRSGHFCWLLARGWGAPKWISTISSPRSCIGDFFVGRRRITFCRDLREKCFLKSFEESLWSLEKNVFWKILKSWRKNEGKVWKTQETILKN